MTGFDRLIDSFIRWVRDNPRTRMIPIGSPHDPIFHRYFVIPRNSVFNVYLHCFHHSDVGDMHDHRMASVSLILQGSYIEERFVCWPVAGRPLPATRMFEVKRLRPLFRRAATPHRVVLHEEAPVVWSLFVGFPRYRNWGFWGRIAGVACWIPHEAVQDAQPEAA